MIGSLLNIGFEGTELPRAVAGLIRNRHLGGITLFTRNFASRRQLILLTRAIRRAADGRPIFICVDQEGGRVQRFREGFTAIPSARSLGEMAGREPAAQSIFKLGRRIGKELAAVGINTNFSPVLDVDTGPVNPIIGDRSFGSDPGLVGRCGVELIRGLAAASVIACGKHFPGHGDTSEDSHLTLPHVVTPRAVMLQRELAPFRAAIKAGLRLVMTAHVVYERVDEKYPATLSSVLINKWLKGTLGFKGLVLSDDLNMKGISERWSLGDAIERGVIAGVDQFLICRPQSGEIESLIVDLEKRMARRPVLRKKMVTTASKVTRFRW